MTDLDRSDADPAAQADADAPAGAVALDADAAGVDAVTAAVESADFVRLLARPDGDSLAAAGVLARALSERETPFQVSVVGSVAERIDRAGPADDPSDATVVIGPCDADTPALDPLAADRPASLLAAAVVRRLAASFDATLALAGAFAAGVDPGAGETEWVLETAREGGDVAADRRPGVAIPTADAVDGLAHSGLVVAPWSGDVDATREALASVDAPTDETDRTDETRQRIASLVALDVVGDPSTATSGATALKRVLRPHETPGGPFATLQGYGDVLDAVARERPGVSVALALGHGAADPALSAWRDHGRRIHAALDGVDPARHDGWCAFDLVDAAPPAEPSAAVEDDPSDAPLAPETVESIARLAAAYRAVEPLAVVIGREAVGVSRTDRRESLGPVVERLARRLDAAYDVGRRAGSIRIEPTTDPDAVLDAAREVIA